MKNKLPDWIVNSADKSFLNDPASYLGHMVFSFQELEHTLVELLGELLCNIDYARIIATEISFNKLIRIIEAFLYQKKVNGATIECFKELKKEITEIEQERNKYVHSYYEITEMFDDSVKYMRLKAKNKSGLKIMTEVIVDSKTFDSLSQRINRVILALLELEL